jgi:hypothetical protein
VWLGAGQDPLRMCEERFEIATLGAFYKHFISALPVSHGALCVILTMPFLLLFATSLKRKMT